jgi:hypothetical protein
MDEVRRISNVSAGSGIGVFALLFGVGLIASIAYYASVFMTRAVVRNALMSDEDPNDSPSAGFLKALNLTSLAVALVTLLIAIGLVIWRSFFLYLWRRPRPKGSPLGKTPYRPTNAGMGRHLAGGGGFWRMSPLATGGGVCRNARC